MNELTIGMLLLLALFTLLSAGLWIALTLIMVGMLGMALLGNDAFGLNYALATWGVLSDWSLAALPLFIWMGEILFRTRLAGNLFDGLRPWLAHLPGRMLHINILSCGMFAAVSGSSAATAATIGRMTLPELRRAGYDERMAIGTLAGAGTLGLLIPPSIILIVYGVAAEVSIARLFVAGVLPGILLVALFMGFTMLWALRHTDAMPADQHCYSWRDKYQSLLNLLPVGSLVALVLGSIFAGWVTPTEAAALGVLGALLLALSGGELSVSLLADSLMGAVKTACMILFILAGAAFLTLAMGFIGLPSMLATEIAQLGLSPLALIACLTLLFVLLGCFLDGISVVLLTTSVVLPMVQQAGIDPLWFGIYLVLVVEMSQITPPVGFNLFVIQDLTGRDMLYIARCALPFFLLLLLACVLITLWPDIVTALPTMM
ncbi:TRAP transporter large permease [Shewanella sp. GXUN23E]|uniref:TRAP transporter large permease n=1 Tax=Shewanella sp. GXUN23E TaxID=3422498 RepID=UPI003D7E75C5